VEQDSSPGPRTVENPLQPIESAAGRPGRPPQAEGLPHAAENRFIVDTGGEFGNKQDIVSVGTEPVDNLFVDALIRDDFHPATVSTGYTTSA
jgi:hypothetical protein